MPNPAAEPRFDLGGTQAGDFRLLTRFYHEAFDETLSRYRAERLLDFFVKTLGPPVYNQAIQDSRAFMTEKLEDLEVEFMIRGWRGERRGMRE